MSTLRATSSFALAALAGAAAAGLARLGAGANVFPKVLSAYRSGSGHPELRLAMVFIDIAKMIWGKDIREPAVAGMAIGGHRNRIGDVPGLSPGSDRVGLRAVRRHMAYRRADPHWRVDPRVGGRPRYGGWNWFRCAGAYLLWYLRPVPCSRGWAASLPVRSPASIPAWILKYLITTLIVVVVGGLGSISGAFWASLLIGVTDTFGRALFPDSGKLLIFGLMALVLLVRSWGVPEEEME